MFIWRCVLGDKRGEKSEFSDLDAEIVVVGLIISSLY